MTSRNLPAGWRRFALFVAGLHVLGLLLWLPALPGRPFLLGMGVIAYTFGMRHALDADHIAAIDNTVRKLTEQRQNPAGVGFFFALGHSSVVLLTAAAASVALHRLDHLLPVFSSAGGVIGGTVSGVFLLLVGLANLAILVRTVRTLRPTRLTGGAGRATVASHARTGRGPRGAAEGPSDRTGWGADGVPAGGPGGPLTALLAPLFRFVGRSWHVYPIGFLFGLGFDTASEIALLSMSAAAANQSVPVTGLLALPVLFSAGMTLLDTADGVWMTSAYRWAVADPVRKFRYNVTVTSLSVMAALCIGGIELVQVWGDRMRWRGSLIAWLEGVDLGPLGIGLIAALGAVWAAAVILSRTARRGRVAP
ncbi:HoxN/HupN/NixA family nickel/cobalt transporter [Alicyclobacillus sp.]|uniref:HoxN/HupN/NixA family nickel/cobalt transporter n=1 Tax=Alicyclobacillus sp. TaxID=61169 RepID=UPI0025C30982|nr:HoxN/HupN/NixA family nickel/cobalt transporter [Alicyclobacillus sp.]MCL6517151.1 HoxN/HupN/NixA family nickel/cobalt transporter [Alicyclobacillus sp.]